MKGKAKIKKKQSALLQSIKGYSIYVGGYTWLNYGIGREKQEDFLWYQT